MQRGTEGEQVDADVPNDVEQNDKRRGDASLPVKTRFQVFGNGRNLIEVDDGNPNQHEQRYPEPVVEIGLRARYAVLEADFAVLDETVAADQGGDARKGNEPPRKSLSTEEEFVGRRRVPGEIHAERHDGDEVTNHHRVIEVSAHRLSNHTDPPFAQLGARNVKTHIAASSSK